MRGCVSFLIAAAVLEGGCYNYDGLGPKGLVPSSYVAVTLTEAGSEELAQYLGPSVHTLRGRFLSATERGLVISVSSVETRRGQLLGWNGESVTVPKEFVWALETRHTALSKTVLLAGASLAGFVAAYAAFGPGASGSTPTSSSMGPNPH